MTGDDSCISGFGPYLRSIYCDDLWSNETGDVAFPLPRERVPAGRVRGNGAHLLPHQCWKLRAAAAPAFPYTPALPSAPGIPGQL